MKLQNGLYIEWVGDEAIALNPVNGELHYLNPPAALAYAHIEEFGFDEGIAKLRSSFGNAPTFEQDLNALIQEFLEKGLLTDGG